MDTASVIGIGRLGLCFGLTLEGGEYNVVGCDINQDYVDSINAKTFVSHEIGVNDKLSASKNFKATTDLKECIDHSRLHFVTVASYSEPDGRYDVSQVDDVVDELPLLLEQEPASLADDFAVLADEDASIKDQSCGIASEQRGVQVDDLVLSADLLDHAPPNTVLA